MINPINLDSLIDQNLSVILKGETVAVKPIDGRCYQLLAKLENGEQAVGIMYEIAQRCLPTLSEEQVFELTPLQVKAVVAVASGKVEEVEQSASPFSEPAGETALSPTPS